MHRSLSSIAIAVIMKFMLRLSQGPSVAMPTAFTRRYYPSLTQPHVLDTHDVRCIIVLILKDLQLWLVIDVQQCLTKK